MYNLSGTGVALITPMTKAGQIDFKSLEKIVNHVIDGGVNYFVVLGTTAETPTLSKQEKKAVLDCVVRCVDKRVPIVVGIGGNNTHQIIADIEQADLAGVTAILSSSPNYNKPTQEGIYQHYKQIARYSPLPIVLYNVPGRTSSNISAETTIRLANEVDNIVGIKEASGNFDQCMVIVKNKPKDFLVISGDDMTALPMIAFGMDGVISVIANALPRKMSSVVRYALEGNFDLARTYHFQLFDLVQFLFEECNPAGIKSACSALDLCNHYVRLPLVPATNELAKKIKDTLALI